MNKKILMELTKISPTYKEYFDAKIIVEILCSNAF
jgi:hypothetical protein